MVQEDKKRNRRLRIQYCELVEITEPLTEEEAIGAHKALSIIDKWFEDFWVHEINTSELEKINKQIEELQQRQRELIYGIANKG